MRGHPCRQQIEEAQQVLGMLREQDGLRLGVVFHIYVVGHIGCVIAGQELRYQCE